MYSHSWVTELSSITKWHIQCTASYSVTAWLAVHHVTCGCAWSSNFNHWKLSSHFVSYYPCRLYLPCFLSWAFLSSSVIFCISGGFYHTGNVRPHRSLLFMPVPNYRMELWEVFQMHALEYKSFSALPKLGMYAQARGRDWLKVTNSVLSPT